MKERWREKRWEREERKREKLRVKHERERERERERENYKYGSKELYLARCGEVELKIKFLW